MTGFLPSLEQGLDEARNASKPLLLLFVGEGGWCKWCNRLESEMQADPVLTDYLSERDFVAARIGLARKDEDTSGLRERFGIKSIPTFILLNERGSEDGRSEYLDEGVPAYVSWLESVDSRNF